MHQLNHIRRAVAVLAVVALPTLTLAQTQAQAAAQPNPAAENLTAARAALNNVLNAPAPNPEAFKKLDELKKHYLALEKAASTAAPEWATHYKEIDRIAGELIGAPAASAEAGAVGTSGRAGLDPAIAANLLDFRTRLAAFSKAMSAVAPAPAASAAPASAAPSSAAPSSAPPTIAPPPSAPLTPPATATPSAAAAAAPPPSTAAAAPPATSDAGVVAQVDAVMALVDKALAANAQIDRATLEQMKSQLEQIKERVKKP